MLRYVYFVAHELLLFSHSYWAVHTVVLIIASTGLLAGPSGIRVGWVIEINGRFEAERPPASAGPPLGGQAATSVPYVWH